MKEKFTYPVSQIRELFGQSVSPSQWGKEWFSSIATSSQEATPHCLFVPLRGARDGHDFIPDALERGSLGFLCQKKHPILDQLKPEWKQKAILVPDTLLALGHLAAFHRERFFPLVLGITGSSGKTTTKELLGDLFSKAYPGEVVVTEKNYNNEIGVPFTLFRISEKTRVVVCEMGMNHRGEIERLTRMAKPKIAVITNIGSAHIENLKSPENIAEEKSDITKGMGKEGVLFVPEDVSFLEIVRKKCKSEKSALVLWKTAGNSDVKILSQTPKGFQIQFQNENYSWNIPGNALLSNALGAIQIGLYAGLSKNLIQSVLKNYKSPDKRLQVSKGFFSVIDDSYNANPESMLSSISASLQLAQKKPLVWVLGTMKELGKFSKHYHSMVGKNLPYPGGALVTFGKDAEWIANSYAGESFSFGEGDLDVKELVELLKSKFSKGTVVLVKGSRSMKMERIVTALKEF